MNWENFFAAFTWVTVISAFAFLLWELITFDGFTTRYVLITIAVITLVLSICTIAGMGWFPSA